MFENGTFFFSEQTTEAMKFLNVSRYFMDRISLRNFKFYEANYSSHETLKYLILFARSNCFAKSYFSMLLKQGNFKEFSNRWL